MAEKKKSALSPLTMLVTVVNRGKAESYADYLANYEINMQMILAAHGTSKDDRRELLGLTNDKAVILSVLRDDMANDALKGLERHFETVRDGRGIAFSVPLSSVVGVTLYKFLSNCE